MSAGITAHWGATSAVYTSRAALDANPSLGFYNFGAGANNPSAPTQTNNCQGWVTGAYEIDIGNTTNSSNYDWPKMAVDVCGNDTIIHMVCTEGPPDAAAAGEIQTLVYYRGVSVGGVVTWPSCGTAIDSVYDITILVKADPTSSEVARSWLKPIYYDNDLNDPCGFTQYQNDVIVQYSTNCGVDWGPFVNVTDYKAAGGGTIENQPMAYTDHSMLYDTDGNLHIVWSTPLKYLAGSGEDPCTPLSYQAVALGR
jgi:hypothetical protein